jgi:antitoxin PrlF
MKLTSKAKITSKNQLTLPKAVRRALGVRSGDEVAFDVTGDSAVVRPVRAENPFEKWAGRFRVGRGWSTKKTVDFVRDLRGRDE